MANTNKFEELLSLVINEETEKAEQLFHDIVVEKSREIYQGIVQEDVDALEIDETKEEESKEEDTTTEAKEEDAVEEAKEETQEETTETVGGDATDDLVSDIQADEAGADPVAQEGDDEAGEESDVEDKVDDLEAAIEELKAEFEKMKAGDSEEGDEDEGAEEETAEEEVAVAPELATESKEVVREYTEQKSADNKDHSDKSAKSPIGQAGAPKVDAKAVQTSTKEDTGSKAPAAKDMGGTTKPNMKEVAKPDNSDKADNKKSAVSGK